MYGYKIYGDHSANPSKDPWNQIGDVHASKEAAFKQAKQCGYRYIEVTDPNGNVIEESEPVNFLLFGGMCYYPSGGYNDLKAKAATEEELREIVAENERKDRYGTGRFEWWQIVNANTHEIVDFGCC